MTHTREGVKILGDFNDSLFSATCSVLLQTMTPLDFTQHIHQATTNHGTLLDHIYTHNIYATECQVYDTYYSYHDLTVLHIRHYNVQTLYNNVYKPLRQ